MIYSNEYFDRKKFQDIIVNDIYIYILKENQIDNIIDLLINKYQLSTKFLNKLYGESEKRQFIVWIMKK